MEKLLISIEYAIKDIQFDIDWMVKTNAEKGNIYSENEINFTKGRKSGLLHAIKLIKQCEVSEKMAKELEESADRMMEVLEKLKIVINGKQP